MKKLLFLLVMLITIKADAQSQFFTTVKIEFEKTVAVRQLYKGLIDAAWYDQIKDRIPVSVLSYFDFVADSNKSIFQPGKETAVDSRSFYRPVADKNIVYTDFKAKRVISQKPVFEETFLVDDSLLKIKWRLTPDTRSIAGYECRKAIGILSDSIVLFAFYTDEIVISGGPEGIHGLPGMILGLGIPRLHSTWFATKVQVTNVNTTQLLPVTKGKKINREALIKSLDKVLKQWGTYGSKLIVNFVI